MGGEGKKIETVYCDFNLGPDDEGSTVNSIPILILHFYYKLFFFAFIF